MPNLTDKVSKLEGEGRNSPPLRKLVPAINAPIGSLFHQSSIVSMEMKEYRTWLASGLRRTHDGLALSVRFPVYAVLPLHVAHLIQLHYRCQRLMLLQTIAERGSRPIVISSSNRCPLVV